VRQWPFFVDPWIVADKTLRRIAYFAEDRQQVRRGYDAYQALSRVAEADRILACGPSGR
jgi:hypothetical protein